MTVQSSPFAAAEPLRPLRILLADDEPLIIASLRQLFERRGHIVHTAGSADQAVQLVSSYRFDVALVDAQMPGDGTTVIAHLEHDPTFNGVLVLMTGALATDPNVQVGPNVIRLQKPFRFLTLLPLVESNVRH